ncbi:MAG: hypothetical protein ACT4NU_03195 [Chromatiales bacterium]
MVAVVALAALLMPTARLAFACQEMFHGWSSVCCCAGEAAASCRAGRGCDAHLAGYQNGCCKVSLQSTDAVPSSLGKAATEPRSPEWVAAILHSSLLPLQTPRVSGVSWVSVPIAVSGRSIYLTTARLRI